MTNLLRAASFVLCGENVEDQLLSLNEACEKSLPIPHDVFVWEPFELESCEMLIEIIQDLEVQFDDANQDYKQNLIEILKTN
jgi:hypothetical protein